MALGLGCGVDSAGGDGLDGGDSEQAGTDAGDGGATGATDGADATGGADDSGGGPVGDGLPCEIEEIIQQSCRSCHGPSNLAPSPMMTREDMLADSLTMPGVSLGEASLARIESADQPMPPPPASALTPEAHDLFAAWIDAGMPAGDCTPDDTPPDPFDADPTCTSDTWWESGLFTESPDMNPGRACIACHTDPGAFGGDPGEQGPPFAAAGTVYPTGHEPDDCFGVDLPDIWVELQGANGGTARRAVLGSGNFFFEPGDVEGLSEPYQVKVIAGELERVMVDPAPHGDCNACHTQGGDEDAPGRIVIPL